MAGWVPWLGAICPAWAAMRVPWLWHRFDWVACLEAILYGIGLGSMFGWVTLLDAMLGRSVSVDKRIAYVWLHDILYSLTWTKTCM